MRTIEDIKARFYQELQERKDKLDQQGDPTTKEIAEFKTAVRWMEICNAERDGRCVVLDEKPLPLIWGDGENSLHCPNCDKDLMGSFAECYDCEKQMWQCPNCGQAIDSRKAITREAALKGAANG